MEEIKIHNTQYHGRDHRYRLILPIPEYTTLTSEHTIAGNYSLKNFSGIAGLSCKQWNERK